MNPSSTASSAATASRRHRETPMHSTSRSMHSSRRDERSTNGPLTAERAMMEQIRSKLERAQLRLAHSQAKSTSRHGYNGNSAAPMSIEGMGIASSSAHHHHHHHSSSRHTHTTHTHSRTHLSTKSHSHSRSQVQSQGPTLPDGGSYYFPPDYKSTRAPVVKSVYLEDLPMVMNADQRTPPVSKDGRQVMTSSKAPSYYAPMDESRVSTRHHQHYEQTQASVKSYVRSERHGVHEVHHHHHHHHGHSRSHRREDHAGSSVSAPPKTTRGVRSTARARQYEDDDVPSAPDSFVSSAFAMHGGVLPLSAIKTSRDAPPPSSTSSYVSYSKQPLTANGQPERSALKHRVESTDDDDGEVVPAPPSSRVRFHEQLTTASYSPVSKASKTAPTFEREQYAVSNQESHAMTEGELYHMPVSMPYELASLVEEEHSDDSDDDNALQPVVNIKHSSALPDEPDSIKQWGSNQDLSTMTIPSSPQNRKSRARSTSNNSDKDLPPRRRRGSSAAQSPSNSNYIRKSLSTLEPPKSAIKLSDMGFEMRPRRASREKQFSQASGDVDVDALSVSEDMRRSSITEVFAGSMVELSSSPIDVGISGISSYGTYDSFGTYDSPRVSQGSLHCSDLMFEDDGSVPYDDGYTPYERSAPAHELKPTSTLTPTTEEVKSPCSSNEYSDARAYPDDEDEESEAQPHATPESQSQEAPADVVASPSPDRTSDESSLSYSDDDVVPQSPRVPSKSEYNDFWQVTSAAAQPEAEPASQSTAFVPPPPPTQPKYHRSRHLAQSHSHVSSQQSPRMPSQLSQSMMVPPTTSTSARNRPPPMSTHIRPSPATARPSVSRPSGNFSASTIGVPRAPATLDGSSYVPRHLRPKSQLTQLRKAMPPSISVLSGLASGPVTFELNVESFYEVVWQTGEFGFSFQRVYLEDENDAGSRRMFLRMLLNTERGTCASFKEVHVGDVLIEIGSTRVCDLQLDNHGGGVALTKFFTDLRNKTPLRLVFQRMDPMSWDGGVEL